MKLVAKYIFTAGFIFLWTVSCYNKSSKLSVKEKHLISESVKTTLEDYFIDISKNGLTAEFKYLDSSEQFFWVPPGYNNPIGYDSVKKAIQKNAINFKSVFNTWETLTVTPLNKEFATYSGTIKSTMIDSSNKESNYLLIETGTVVKRADGWKLLCGQTNMLK